VLIWDAAEGTAMWKKLKERRWY